MTSLERHLDRVYGHPPEDGEFDPWADAFTLALFTRSDAAEAASQRSALLSLPGSGSVWSRLREELESRGLLGDCRLDVSAAGSDPELRSLYAHRSETWPPGRPRRLIALSQSGP